MPKHTLFIGKRQFGIQQIKIDPCPSGFLYGLAIGGLHILIISGNPTAARA